VDFYVSRKHPAAGRQRHSWFTRTIWPAWFATDNVFLSPDHLPYLASRFAPLRLDERRGRLPFVVGARVPYYLFIGKKS
jgi:S-adenosylmethionine-diacylgycerolhomoserine-N-methlytransferase